MKNTNLHIFTRSEGKRIPKNYKRFKSNGDLHNMCVICQEKEHKFKVQIPNRDLYYCETCKDYIKTHKPSLQRSIESELLYGLKTYQPSEELTLYIFNGVLPKDYTLPDKGRLNCYFCKAHDVHLAEFSAPVGMFDTILPPKLICENCQTYINNNVEKLERHFLEVTCFNCGNDYLMNEKQLMARVNLSFEEYNDISSDDIKRKYQHMLMEYYCSNCMISNGHVNEPLIVSIQCEGCLDMYQFNNCQQSGLPEQFYCHRCEPYENKHPAIIRSMRGKVIQEDTAQRVQSRIEDLENKTVQDSPNELFSALYKKYEKSNTTKYRFIVYSWKTPFKGETKVMYYYIIYEEVEEESGEEIDANIMFHQKYGTLSVIFDSTDDNGYYPQTVEGLFNVIRDARSYCNSLI